MTVEPNDVLIEITGMLRETMGEFGPAAQITSDSTFYGLGLESLEIVALGGRIQAHYGWSVNFVQFAAGVSVGNLEDVTLGQMVDFVVESLNSPTPAAGS